jgi:hypothetical protein
VSKTRPETPPSPRPAHLLRKSHLAEGLLAASIGHRAKLQGGEPGCFMWIIHPDLTPSDHFPGMLHLASRQKTLSRGTVHRQQGPRAIRPFNLNASKPGLWHRILSFVLLCQPWTNPQSHPRISCRRLFVSRHFEILRLAINRPPMRNPE